jgi:Bacterial PH domain
MEQTVRVYRGRLRNVVLCVAFGLVAVLLAVAAAISRDSVGAVVAFGVLALVMLYFAVRTAMMKAVATPGGLNLHGPLRTFAVPWSEITEIRGADTETDARLLPVRAPVLVLANGRRLKLSMVSSYSLFTGNRSDSTADRVAAELESLRAASTR